MSANRTKLSGCVAVVCAFLFTVVSDAASAAHAPVCEAQAPGRCLYASPGENGDGTAHDPAGLHQALIAAAAGDVVYLYAGEYTTIIDTGLRAVMNLEKDVAQAQPLPSASAPLTVKAYPGDEVTIRGDFTSPCVIIDRRSHYRFEGFQVANCLNHGIQLGLDLPGEDVVFRNLELTRTRYVDNAGFLTINGYSDVRIEAVDFHDYETTNPNGNSYFLKLFRARNITVSGSEFHGVGAGIYYKHGEDSGGDGGFTRILNNRFYNLSSARAVALNQNRVLLQGNLFLGADIGVHYEDGTQAPFTFGTEIEFNTFVDGGVELNAGSDGYLPGEQLGAFDTTVFGNIFQNSSYRVWHYGPDSLFSSGVGLFSASNCFFDQRGQQAISYFGASGSWGSAGDVYDLSQWQSLGFGIDSVETDPMLGPDWLPQESSLCRTMGHGATNTCPSGVMGIFCDRFER